MELLIQHTDEDTGRKFVVKNKDTKVFIHDSEIHDDEEFEELTGRVMKLEPEHSKIVNVFYQLCGNLL